MPTSLEDVCERILEEVVTVSQRIRRSTLVLANNQPSIAQGFCYQLERIRISAEIILASIARTSLTSDTLDDRICMWLISGELPTCLARLKEMEDMLGSPAQLRFAYAPARPLRLIEDKLMAIIAFFDRHRNIFHFMLTSDAWNCDILQRSPEWDTFPFIKGSKDNAMSSKRHGVTATQDSETEYFTATEYDTTSEYDQGEKRSLSISGQKLSGRDRKLLQQKLDEVSKWLAAFDCTKRHNLTLQLRQEGTCTWLPNTDVFREWRTSATRFLWLHGKAGSGKSVLAASTVEHIKKTLRMEEVVLFFYCDFRDDRSTNPTEVMRSLLSQLLQHLRDLCLDPGDHLNRILQQKREGTLLLDDLDSLCALIWRAASCLYYDPIIVIDALDECADMEALLRILVKLKQGDVRILVTSRPHDVIMDHFKGLKALSLEIMTRETKRDIEMYLGKEIELNERLRLTDADMKEEIRIELNKRAEGRFRWVQCQLDMLKRCESRQELRQALDNLPDELEATYERILGVIDERNSEGKLARRVLAWLSVTLEPLRLAQVVEGLVVDRDHSVQPETQSVARSLIQALSSLVEYYEETDILSFSHFSVKEYLMGQVVPPIYRIVSQEAHTEVVQICMRYLSVVLKRPSRGRAIPLKPCTALSYVLSSGFNHLAHVDPKSTVTLEALRSLEMDVRHHPSHWEHLCELREEHFRWLYPLWPSSRHEIALYILIAYSSPGLLRLFLLNQNPLKSRIQTNPLVYATDLHKTKHANILLACSLDINARGLMIEDSHHTSPLDLAIDRGEDEIVGELLQKRCVVSSELLSTAICMPWCSTPVLVKLMQTDEFVEWAHNIGCENLYRSVFNSARPNAGDSKKVDQDHVTLARILRQVGVDLSADSPFGAELIERAIHAAHTSMLDFLLPQDRPPPSRFLLAASTGDTSETVSVVRFLLRREVDVHAVTPARKDTPLHLAAMCPWEPRRLELVKLLIDAGSDPFVCNSEHQTVFDVAIKRNYDSVVDLVLSCKVPCPPGILLISLQNHWPLNLVRAMVHSGADVHSTTSDGDSVLHLAITKYEEPLCLDLVKILVEGGCKPTSRNSRGKTAFDVAIKHRYSLVVARLSSRDVPFPSDILLVALQECSPVQMIRYLIEKQANVHPITSDGDGVLDLAISGYAESTCLDLVKLLIASGCDPGSRNSKGESALEAAIKRGYISVVGFLLSPAVQCRVPLDILPVTLQKKISPQMIEYLVQNEADVHATTSKADTVLHLAITEYDEERSLQLIKMFTQAGCSPFSRNFADLTALEIALGRGYVSVVEQVLLSNNATFPLDILPTSMWKVRPSLEMIQYLVRNGADVHQATPYRDTVVHLAIFRSC